MIKTFLKSTSEKKAEWETNTKAKSKTNMNYHFRPSVEKKLNTTIKTIHIKTLMQETLSNNLKLKWKYKSYVPLRATDTQSNKNEGT